VDGPQLRALCGGRGVWRGRAGGGWEVRMREEGGVLRGGVHAWQEGNPSNNEQGQRGWMLWGQAQHTAGGL
jgi:hypothetical protein